MRYWIEAYGDYVFADGKGQPKIAYRVMHKWPWNECFLTGLTLEDAIAKRDELNKLYKEGVIR